MVGRKDQYLQEVMLSNGIMFKLANVVIRLEKIMDQF
jgi:hypothetical protein